MRNLYQNHLKHEPSEKNFHLTKQINRFLLTFSFFFRQITARTFAPTRDAKRTKQQLVTSSQWFYELFQWAISPLWPSTPELP